MTLLQYQQAKHTFDNVKDKDQLESYRDFRLMDLVVKTTFSLKKEKMAARNAPAGGPLE